MNTIYIRDLIIGEGRPKICVPICGKNQEEILGEAEKIHELPADVVEWRADWYDDIFDVASLQKILEALRGILGEKPILFRGAKIVPCKNANQQRIYRIKVDGIGIEYNRRGAFRCFLGQNVALHLEDDPKQYRAILKDISSTGFGVVLTTDVLSPDRLEQGMKCSTSINDKIDRFNNVNIGLQGTVCRVTEVDGGKYVCGCELLMRSYEIDRYISLKERINLARKQMNANSGSRYEPKRRT